MKSTLLFVFSLLVSSHVIAQDRTVYVYEELPREQLFTWGDNYYEQNLRGLGFLMNDVRELEPDLYAHLQPRYAQLRRRQTEANAILGITSLTTVALFVAAVVPPKSTNNFPQPVSNDFDEDMRRTVGLILGGALVGAAGGVIYFNRAVRQPDLLNFTNQFNQKTTGEPLKLDVRPAFGLDGGFSGGFGLCLHF